jgi:hypothetical protein
MADIHGRYYDLFFSNTAVSRQKPTLFLGDYVDQGKQSLETICLLLAYKIKYPEIFFECTFSNARVSTEFPDFMMNVRWL